MWVRSGPVLQEVWVEIKVTDLQNRSLTGRAETPPILLTNDWGIYVKYDKEKYIAPSETITAKLILDNASIGKVHSVSQDNYYMNAAFDWMSVNPL